MIMPSHVSRLFRTTYGTLIDVTRQQFAATATLQSGQVAADMRALARTSDTNDAIARLTQDPYWNALLRTTCVPTEINGGHAPNALPQRAIATLNCRLLPGHPASEVIASIKAVVASAGHWHRIPPRTAGGHARRSA